MYKQENRQKKIEDLIEYMWPIMRESEEYATFKDVDKDTKLRIFSHVAAILPLIEEREREIKKQEDGLYGMMLITNYMTIEKYDGKSMVQIIEEICKHIDIQNPLV